MRLWKASGNTKLVVLLPPYGGDQNYYNSSKLPSLLNVNNIDFAVIHPGNVGYTRDDDIKRLDSLIALIVKKYHYSPDGIIIGGFSAGGYGAMKYVLKKQKGELNLSYAPKAVFSVDAPLDMERWYTSLNLVRQRVDTANMMYGEANYLVGMFNELYGSPPAQNVDIYRKNSVVSVFLPDGGNAIYFKNIPVRLYTEPDINWYIDHLNLDYLLINAIDQAALVSILKLQGNKNVSLVTTTGKGYRPELNNIRMPHSWQIVDENELVNWIVRYIK
ncbi:MAG: alpha/beta-hydrolase superfamily protein [Mucilaginibacter sp.]|nr:alpha/beta-hydrolase superfamily protein [Mucilaginibacter sp.]